MKLKILFWIPRILALIFILIMLMFSLDVFNAGESLGRMMLGFLVHNIPVLILLAILIIAWNWETAGGILFILASAYGFVFFHSFSGNPGSIIVIGPFLIIGILFIIHSVLKGRSSTANRD